MWIVLDTNILASDFAFKGPSFETLVQGIPRVGHVLAIPQLVLDELINKYQEEYRRALNSQRRLGVGVEGPIHPQDLSSLEDATDSYRDYVHRRLPFAKIMKYPDIPHEQLVRRALCRYKPFRNKDTGGYRDALLWHSTLSVARTSPSPIALITRNLRDFADPTDQSRLHQDLVQDLISLGLPDNSVHLYASLESFIQEHIVPTLAVLEDIRNRLQTGSFETLNLHVFSSTQLQQHLGWREFAPHEIGFPSEYETSHLSIIERINEISNIDVHQLPSNDLLISYEIEAECEFDFFIFKADYFTLPDDKLPYIWSHDWSEHYLAASDSSNVRLRIALLFSTEDKTVNSAQVSNAEPTKEWWERQETQ